MTEAEPPRVAEEKGESERLTEPAESEQMAIDEERDVLGDLVSDDHRPCSS